MPYQYFPNILGGLQTNFDDFRSNFTNVSRVFRGVPRQFPMTFGATIPMFLECFGESPDHFQLLSEQLYHVSQLFWGLPEQLYQCCSSISGGHETILDDFRSNYTSVLVGLQTISGDFPWKYTHVTQLFWGAVGPT
jgi:hypothetical protein